jgi:hypothetical protein
MKFQEDFAPERYISKTFVANNAYLINAKLKTVLTGFLKKGLIHR